MIHKHVSVIILKTKLFIIVKAFLSIRRVRMVLSFHSFSSKVLSKNSVCILNRDGNPNVNPIF